MPKKDEIDLFKHVGAIRDAYRAGRRSIAIQGRMFNIALRVRDVHFEVKTGVNQREPKQQKESWLVVSPNRGQTPVANIELEHQGNMRTVRVR